MRSYLYGAVLIKADLSNADLTASSLIRANLTSAIINGVCIDQANLSEWIIKDITCTHINQHDPSEKMIKFAPYEFEQKYSYIPQIVEMVLNIPLTESSTFIAEFMAQTINYLEKSPVIKLKGVEGLSDDKAKFTFIVFNNAFYETKKDNFQLAQDEINESLQGKTIEPEKELFFDSVDPIADATDGIFVTREAIPLAFFEIRPKKIEEKAISLFNRNWKWLNPIYQALYRVFK